MGTLIAVLIVVLILIVAGMVGWTLLQRYNASQEPQNQRKWTDPKHHDKIP